MIMLPVGMAVALGPASVASGELAQEGHVERQGRRSSCSQVIHPAAKRRASVRSWTPPSPACLVLVTFALSGCLSGQSDVTQHPWSAPLYTPDNGSHWASGLGPAPGGARLAPCGTLSRHPCNSDSDCVSPPPHCSSGCGCVSCLIDTDCPAGELCHQGDCRLCGVDVCSGDAREVLRCDVEQQRFEVLEECASETQCTNGACTRCGPGARRCDRHEVQECAPAGDAWSTVQECAQGGMVCRKCACFDACGERGKLQDSAGCGFVAVGLGLSPGGSNPTP